MAKVSLGGFEFDVNPSTFSWGYTLNTWSKDTYGGRVVQILSCKLNDCTVQGYLPVSKDPDNAYAEMEKFEAEMLDIMDWQARAKKPLKFSFPLLGWEGTVYLTQYGSVSYSYDVAAVTYTLGLSVDDGFEQIRQNITAEAQTSIDSIPNGVNWVRNIYNTPNSTTWEKSLEVIKEILEDSGNYQSVGLKDYYEMLMEKVATDKKNKNLTYASVKDVTESSIDIMNNVIKNNIQGVFGAMLAEGAWDASTTGFV